MKTKYYCEYCNRVFDSEKACETHEKQCGAVADWVKVGNYFGCAATGEVWQIAEYDEENNQCVAVQVPYAIGGRYKRVTRMSPGYISSRFDHLTIERYTKDTLPIGNSVYIPGIFAIAGIQDGVVNLVSEIDLDVSIQIPVNRLHKVCAHDNTEIPAANVELHDEATGESCDFLQLMDTGDF